MVIYNKARHRCSCWKSFVKNLIRLLHSDVIESGVTGHMLTFWMFNRFTDRFLLEFSCRR